VLLRVPKGITDPIAGGYNGIGLGKKEPDDEQVEPDGKVHDQKWYRCYSPIASKEGCHPERNRCYGTSSLHRSRSAEIHGVRRRRSCGTSCCRTGDNLSGNARAKEQTIAMADADNGRRRFRVHCSNALTQALLQLQRHTLEAKRKRTIASAFRRIVERLQFNPLGFGEPYYRLPALHLQIRTCIVHPLGVHFAVSEDQPLAFIKAVRLLPDKSP